MRDETMKNPLRTNKLPDTPEKKITLPGWFEKIPMGRMAATTDVRNGAVYLASPASDCMTGAALTIDGGYRCW
jgi:NAD(P)-dependent dehydrogenase (short-subunit alcohol dehydrogenase family)